MASADDLWGKYDTEDSEDDDDYVPEAESENDNAADEQLVDTDEDEEEQKDDQHSLNNTTTTSTESTGKRQADEQESKKKRSRTNANSTDDPERRARIDAIWADMNDPLTSSGRPNTETTKEKSPSHDQSDSASHLKKDISGSSKEIPKTTEQVSSVASKSKPLTSRHAVKPSIGRPKSTLSDLVSQYNIKVPKMNTLEKSKLDWQGYVEKEGIRDELRYKNKDGYMEKVAFLQRVDDRRRTQLKAGQRSSKQNQTPPSL